MDIEYGRFGRIVAADSDEGMFLHVCHDVEDTSGFYVYLVDDIDNPAAGGDHWTQDPATFIRQQGWQVEWLDRRCAACSS
ncbi:hypothetical protein ACFO1B_34360 [Dactylosporangium siamense]|uniref:Uncharacterized protein n=1 Tax=Dactylosporangium siamense TaxID=685454 RepID=A0A919PME9_9ACTN|nr:hypothetical protein [Dactylosporangium siamense]GIG44798.1 hypothetical protein Dsi01nite_028390 [Dactylosporangium siamense]